MKYNHIPLYTFEDQKFRQLLQPGTLPALVFNDCHSFRLTHALQTHASGDFAIQGSFLKHRNPFHPVFPIIKQTIEQFNDLTASKQY